MTLYKKINGNFIQLTAEEEIIALNDTNMLYVNDSGYRCILSNAEITTIQNEWALNENPVPKIIEPLQFRKALKQLNKIVEFRTYVQGLTTDEQEDWLYAKYIRRNAAMVEAARISLGFTNNQVDNLFRTAATIEV